MHALFDPDSKFAIIFTRLTELVLLNFVFFLTCLPVFTIGAANSALYDVVFRMGTHREGMLLRSYFRAFRLNFGQSTLLWLLLILFGAVSYGNMVFSSHIGGILGYVLFLISLFAFLLVLIVFSYTFPWQSQFFSKPGQTLRNALLLGLAHLPRTAVLLALNCFPWVLMFVNFYAFLKLGMLWAFLYFAAAAYYASRVLEKVFQPYREATPKE